MPDSDATIKITVSTNKMKATANYIPAAGNGKPILSDDVLDNLESMNINTGYNLLKTLFPQGLSMV